MDASSSPESSVARGVSSLQALLNEHGLQPLSVQAVEALESYLNPAPGTEDRIEEHVGPHHVQELYRILQLRIQTLIDFVPENSSILISQPLIELSSLSPDSKWNLMVALDGVHKACTRLKLLSTDDQDIVDTKTFEQMIVIAMSLVGVQVVEGYKIIPSPCIDGLGFACCVDLATAEAAVARTLNNRQLLPAEWPLPQDARSTLVNDVPPSLLILALRAAAFALTSYARWTIRHMALQYPQPTHLQALCSTLVDRTDEHEHDALVLASVAVRTLQSMPIKNDRFNGFVSSIQREIWIDVDNNTNNKEHAFARWYGAIRTKCMQILLTNGPCYPLSSQRIPGSSLTGVFARNARSFLNDDDRRVFAFVRARASQGKTRGYESIHFTKWGSLRQHTGITLRTSGGGSDDENKTIHTGPFDGVFLPKQTNQQIAESIDARVKVVEKIFDGQDVVVAGLGVSGAGKTSTLVYLANDDDATLPQQQGIVGYWLEMLGTRNPITKFTVTVHEYASWFRANGGNVHRTYPTQRFGSPQQAIVHILGVVKSQDRVRSTPNNEESSRSHIRIDISASYSSTTSGRLILLDLAGAETRFDEANMFQEMKDVMLKNEVRAEPTKLKWLKFNDLSSLVNSDNYIDHGQSWLTTTTKMTSGSGHFVKEEEAPGQRIRGIVSSFVDEKKVVFSRLQNAQSVTFLTNSNQGARFPRENMKFKSLMDFNTFVKLFTFFMNIYNEACLRPAGRLKGSSLMAWRQRTVTSILELIGKYMSQGTYSSDYKRYHTVLDQNTKRPSTLVYSIQTHPDFNKWYTGVWNGPRDVSPLNAWGGCFVDWEAVKTLLKLFLDLEDHQLDTAREIAAQLSTWKDYVDANLAGTSEGVNANVLGLVSGLQREYILQNVGDERGMVMAYMNERNEEGDYIRDSLRRFNDHLRKTMTTTGNRRWEPTEFGLPGTRFPFIDKARTLPLNHDAREQVACEMMNGVKTGAITILLGVLNIGADAKEIVPWIDDQELGDIEAFERFKRNNRDVVGDLLLHATRMSIPSFEQTVVDVSAAMTRSWGTTIPAEEQWLNRSMFLRKELAIMNGTSSIGVLMMLDAIIKGRDVAWGQTGVQRNVARVEFPPDVVGNEYHGLRGGV